MLHSGAVACQLDADEPRAETEKQNYPETDILSLQQGCKAKKKKRSALMYQNLRLPLQFKKVGDRQTL